MRPLAVGLALVMAGCTPQARAVVPQGQASVVMTAADERRSDPAEVIAEVRGPLQVRYVPALLGRTRPLVHVVVRNRGSSPLDVSNLRVRLEATRDGVPFPCASEVASNPRAREPEAVAPNASATFERALDCSLPLVGEYVLDLAVAFGRTGPWAAGRSARTLALRVVAVPNDEPRPIRGVAGLWGAIGASTVMASTTRDAKGRLVLAIVNGGSAPVTVPPMRLGLRVYRAGLDIPCEDEPTALKTPASLPPGASYVERIDVSCLGLGKPGQYEIIARLLVADVLDENEVGRIRVEVSAPQTPIHYGPTR